MTVHTLVCCEATVSLVYCFLKKRLIHEVLQIYLTKNLK